MLVFCVLHWRCRGTGVNVLEKSDLGQRPCLHLSLWQAGALGGWAALNKGERVRDKRGESWLFQMEKRKTWLDCDLCSQRQALCYKQPFDINLISFTSSLRIKTVKASANKRTSPCLLPSVFPPPLALLLLSPPPQPSLLSFLLVIFLPLLTFDELVSLSLDIFPVFPHPPSPRLQSGVLFSFSVNITITDEEKVLAFPQGIRGAILCFIY